MPILKWTKVAEPILPLETNKYIYTLCVFNNKLYCAGDEYEDSFAGALLEWNGVDSWIEAAPTFDNEIIYDLEVFENELYGVNTYSGLLKWNGADAWIRIINNAETGSNWGDLCECNGKFYCTGGAYSLAEFDGINSWVAKASSYYGQGGILTLVKYHDELYGGTWSPGYYGRGCLLKWNGVDAWTEMAPTLDNLQNISDLIVYDDKIYGSTISQNSYNGARLYEWNGINAWVQRSSTKYSQTALFGMVEYMGRICGGTTYNGYLFDWKTGDSGWHKIADQFETERVFDTVVYNGLIYGASGYKGMLLRHDYANTMILVGGEWIETVRNYELMINKIDIWEYIIEAFINKKLNPTWNDWTDETWDDKTGLTWDSMEQVWRTIAHSWMAD